MKDLEAELDGTEVEIEIEGGSEALANDLRKVFDGDEEDVVFGHAFGGIDLITIVTNLGKGMLSKLADCWTQIQTTTPKTKLRISGKSISMDGFSREDILALSESSDFQKLVAGVRKP